MSVLAELRVFFLSDPAKIGAQPVSPEEIVAAVRSKPSTTLQPSPLARKAAELLADSESQSSSQAPTPAPGKAGDA
jgi:hypothetical protein